MPDKRIRFLVDHVAFLANEHGTYVPKQKITDTLGQASQQYHDSLLRPKQAVRFGKTYGPGANRAVDSRLAPFKRVQAYTADPVLVSDTVQLLERGKFTLPADCAYVDYYDAEGAVTVEEVEGHALLYRRADPINGPTKAAPIVGTVEEGKKQWLPVTVPALTLHYYAKAVKPVYGLSDPDDDTSYDDAASVDTGWDEAAEPELIARTLTLLGIPLRDAGLQQAGIAHTNQDI